MAKKITIKDIAKELNTNFSTVSRALNNNPRISEEMRAAVLKQAKLMGYQPNTLAQQLKKGYSNTIGLIVPRINRVFFSNVIHGVETIAKKNGYNVIICQSNEKADEEFNNVQTLLSNNIAGIIMSVSRETNNDSAIKEVEDREIPLVMFDRTILDKEYSEVVNDNFQGAYNAVSHLIQQGYQRIVHFSGPLFIKSYRERFEAYRQALSDHNLEYDERLLAEDVLTRDKGWECVKNLKKNDVKFDAIFSASDYSALGAMLCLQEEDVAIPQEVGVCGFANELFAELIGLTSVEQHSVEIGKSAAELLLKKIHAEHPKTENIKIKTELIKRKSTNKKL